MKQKKSGLVKLNKIIYEVKKIKLKYIKLTLNLMNLQICLFITIYFFIYYFLKSTELDIKY